MKLFRVLLFVGVTTAAVAQTNAPQSQVISLQDCVQQALENNLDLKIQRYNPVLSAYSVKSSQAGYDPGFSFSAQHNYNKSAGNSFDQNTGLPRPGSVSESDSLNSGLNGLLPWGMDYSLSGSFSESYGTSSGNRFDTGRGSVSANLTQPLLKNFWIDSTRLSIHVAKISLRQSELGLRNSIMNITTSTENAYYDLIAAIENVKVRQKALELAERLLSENKKRVQVGALAPLDEKQAESQVASARADLVSARQSLASQQNILKSLLTDDYVQLHNIELRPVESLTAPVENFDLQQSWNNGMTLRPDLQQAKLDLERQGIQLKYDRNQLFPELDVFGSYGYGAGGVNTVSFSDAFADIASRDLPSYSYGVSVSIPLSNRRARYNYKSSKLSVEQALLTLKKLEQSILTQIDNAVIAARASYERVDATRAAREYAEAALEAEQKKLESGKSTSFFVLQLQRDLTAAQSSEIGALADYNKALANLALSEGTTLERRNVVVEVK